MEEHARAGSQSQKVKALSQLWVNNQSFSKGMPRGSKEAQEIAWFYIGITQRTSTNVTSMDCQHGNPMNATSSVTRPKSRDSHVKDSVLDVSKNEEKKEAVYIRKNKQTDNTFAKRCVKQGECN
ncbi:hypothetical protein Tco_0975000 [Tanacetum coccineum]|uniref:Uncharacterized protein n=1 Tax=Tanacetum coccineum TaxID=301880 RepID=A0ABQ5ED82_9ASTR